MPWKPKDATRFTHKAKSAIAKRQFAHVANSVLESTGDEGGAIREANAVIGKRAHGMKRADPHDPYKGEGRK